MTPLHMFACFPEGHNVEIYKCMVEKYPNALLIKDRWGDIPLSYALYAEHPLRLFTFSSRRTDKCGGTCPLILAI